MRPQQAVGIWSLIIGAGWLIPLMPFCPLLRAMHDSYGTPLVEHLYAQATLWDVDASVSCNTRIPMLKSQAESVCKNANIRGRHDFLEASRIACRLESKVYHQYTYGCDRFSVLHVAGYGVAFLWGVTATLQMCAAVNTFLYDLPHYSSRHRRRYMLAFYLLAPITGWVGVLLYWNTFSLTGAILPSLVRVRPGAPQIAWGTIWAFACAGCSTAAALFIVLSAEEPSGWAKRMPWEDAEEPKIAEERGESESDDDRRKYRTAKSTRSKRAKPSREAV